MKFGIDVLLEDRKQLARLKKRQIGLLGHPASLTAELHHSLDATIGKGLRIEAAFGPQHGICGDKQDNMVETADSIHPIHGIPVFSLYGKTRRLTSEMLDAFDILLVDMQDIGCRIYTFISTLFYLLEDCAAANKQVWILDRPNPIGRPVEGPRLVPGQESFVGAAPIPIRHGLTLGEAAEWFCQSNGLDLDLTTIRMQNYQPDQGPGYGWPLHERPWVNPSPNIPTLNAARVFPGSVLLEGTTISEGRGTTRSLETIGAPDIPIQPILEKMRDDAVGLFEACRIRPCWFEPTFNKHRGNLCHGFQVHTDCSVYRPEAFRPYRLMAMFLKTLRTLSPSYPIWRDFPYEYVTDRLAIDMINGSTDLREWVDNPDSGYPDLDSRLVSDEVSWLNESRPFRLY